MSLAVYLDHLIGKAGRHWVMSDFEFAPPRHDWDEEEQTEADGALPEQPSGEQNLYHLTVESLGLIDAEARAQALSDLAGLAGGLCRALDDFGDDPVPRLACAAWPEKARTALPEWD